MIAAVPAPPTCVVVGRGRLGRALSAALGLAGRLPETVPGRVASDHPEVVLQALRRAGPGTVVLLAVPDGSLEVLASALSCVAGHAPAGTVFLHLSGALGTEVLKPLAPAGVALGACHPLQTFPGTSSDAGRFDGIAFAIDGDGSAREAASLLARALGGRPFTVEGGARVLYHLAASLGANGLTGLVAASRDALVAAGLDAGEALEALGPLLRTALEEALSSGPESALTGPTARGDDATVDRHRRALVAWDASRLALFEALLREQRRLAARAAFGTRC